MNPGRGQSLSCSSIDKGQAPPLSKAEMFRTSRGRTPRGTATPESCTLPSSSGLAREKITLRTRQDRRFLPGKPSPLQAPHSFPVCLDSQDQAAIRRGPPGSPGWRPGIPGCAGGHPPAYRVPGNWHRSTGGSAGIRTVISRIPVFADRGNHQRPAGLMRSMIAGAEQKPPIIHLTFQFGNI